MLGRLVFALALVFVASPALVANPWATPPVALVLGVVFGLTLENPFLAATRKWTKRLLQIAVVGLGFGMNLQEVLRVGAHGFLYTLIGIIFAMGLGMALGRVFSVGRNAAMLISAGTAICGGSAIAAVGPVIGARDEEMSVSIGTVFLLNAVGLVLFPWLGKLLQLSQTQFGLWAALAIHDTSSVVGAGAKYGVVALGVATTVKLARALWIVPLTLAIAGVQHRQADLKKISWPWFILFFVGAAVISTYIPGGRPGWNELFSLAKVVLNITLFLIGTGITRKSLREVGVRPLMQGIALWIVVAVSSLALIRWGVARI
jgi:uncharacterized integral membrane protein (TIGR00698 family)